MRGWSSSSHNYTSAIAPSYATLAEPCAIAPSIGAVFNGLHAFIVYIVLDLYMAMQLVKADIDCYAFALHLSFIW